MHPAEPDWQLCLQTPRGSRPVVVAELGLQPPSRLTVRVTGVEVLGEDDGRIVRLPPAVADLGVEVDARRLPDPELVARWLRTLRTRLQTGVAAPD